MKPALDNKPRDKEHGAATLLKRAGRSLFRAKGAVVGLLVILVVVLMAVLAPYLTHWDPTDIRINDRLIPPMWAAGGSSAHPLGTDPLGRDVWALTVYGARVSVMVGICAVFLAGFVGVLLGLVAGFYGGFVDDLLMRLADIQLSFPFILLALSVMAVLGPGLLNVILVLGLTGWVEYARVVRAQVLSLRQTEFVESAHASGLTNVRIMFRHVLPNSFAPVIVIASLSVARTIISEASLSFLGLGVPADVPTWGRMISDGREFIDSAWWLVTFPGIAMMLAVLGINLFGDWLRDYLDPRLRSTL